MPFKKVVVPGLFLLFFNKKVMRFENSDFMPNSNTLSIINNLFNQFLYKKNTIYLTFFSFGRLNEPFLDFGAWKI